MSWWNSLEKAGGLSKIAYTALKTAQQKIDEALDINEEIVSNNKVTPYKHGDSSVEDETDIVKSTGSFTSGSSHTPLTQAADWSSSIDFSQWPTVPRQPSSPSQAVDSDFGETETLCQTDNTEELGQLHELAMVDRTQEFGVTEDPSSQCLPNAEVITTPSEYSSYTLDNSPIDTSIRQQCPSSLLPPRALSTGHLPTDNPIPQCHSPSCSPVDTPVDSSLSDPIGPSTSPEYVEDSSSIEVISCGNSNNEGSSMALQPPSNNQHSPTNACSKVPCTECTASPLKSLLPVTVKTADPHGGRRSLSPHRDLFKLQHTPVPSLRDYSAPVVDFIRRHRRAVSASHDFRSDANSPSHDDVNCAYFRLSKNYADKKYLLNVREEKILQLSKENAQLREANAILEE